MRCLGFSDLTADEAFFVAVYRDWVTGVENPTAMENGIAKILSHHRLFGALDTAFAIFRDVISRSDAISGYGDVLSRHEEDVLELLGTALRHASVLAQQSGRVQTTVMLRAPSHIQRTGQDELRQKVNTASWAVTCYM